ncbi:dTDP-4-dehydrorhamnose 3,5-epimerase [Ruegeria lacuscaerulensis]|uniref:dTDP-4-dehydrorhamnose 3,5-epimerase n=1 Tax=Ruegeria lacuscaerulensis TaxID=55218 RepID=UPI001481C628|nr:dTDP-4-dehydrorhamnose 3,5-epimerase [Ruegeria lacuscaerulensis]
MLFTPTPLEGAYLIELEKRGDDRGFFARMFCEDEFKAHGLVGKFMQINNSLTMSKGTVRGMHYQLPPHAEVKLMRCVKGAIFDVIVDLRDGSKTFGQWFGAELTAENRKMMYVPKGFAHGFMSLTDDTEIIYPVSAAYAPESERGLRWDDPAIGINWPMAAQEVSQKDQTWNDLDRSTHAVKETE